jgi:hypothetical protein
MKRLFQDNTSTTAASRQWQQQMRWCDSAVFRGVVALTNLGASVLERGCYRKGMLVLRDSLNALHKITAEMAIKGSVAVDRVFCDERFAEEIASNIQAANRHLANAAAARPADASESELSVVELSVGTMDFNSVQSLLEQTLTYTKEVSLGPILKLAHCECDTSSSFVVNLLSAITLYNYGLSTLRLGSENEELARNKQKHQLLQRSRQFLHLSLSLLHSCYCEETAVGAHATTTLDDLQRSTVLLFISSVSLANWRHASSMVGDKPDAQAQNIHEVQLHATRMLRVVRAMVSGVESREPAAAA